MQYHAYPMPPSPNEFKGVTIYWKPCVWICPLENGGIYFMPGENNVHYGESKLWCLKNRIRSRLFHKARKNIHLKSSIDFLNKYCTGSELK